MIPYILLGVGLLYILVLLYAHSRRLDLQSQRMDMLSTRLDDRPMPNLLGPREHGYHDILEERVARLEELTKRLNK